MKDELLVQLAASDLQPFVQRYWGYAHFTGQPARQREPISTGAILIFGLDTELDLIERDGSSVRIRSFAAGLADECAVIQHDGRMCGLQVDLSPIAARMVFRTPMRELAHRVVSVDELFGREGAMLEEQLATAGSWNDRFALVESLLRSKLAAAPLPPADVQWAWRRLSETRGRLRVDRLAAEIGCSRKHLAARFREHVGAPPKLVARIHRFRHALDSLARDGDSSVAEIAWLCGYYDEAHLDREFRQFAGTTPGAYRLDPRAVTFVQDEAAVAA